MLVVLGGRSFKETISRAAEGALISGVDKREGEITSTTLRARLAEFLRDNIIDIQDHEAKKRSSGQATTSFTLDIGRK